MTSIEQNHSGSGDNVRDKIYIEIKSLAPSDLLIPMEMVFESLRKKDPATAKIQMTMLKALAQKDHEAAALVEVISIYGELVEVEEQGAAWGTVSKIAASAKNAIVKDFCLAALLRLARRTERESAAKEHYLAEPAPGPYSKEAFLRSYADTTQLEAASQQFILSEGELTGIVEGALRLDLDDLANRMAKRLSDEYKSYNADVLQAMASASTLNGHLFSQHLWLNSPEVKQRLDDLTARVVELMERSDGTDVRLYNMACPIFETYQGLAPPTLFEILKKNLEVFDPIHPETAARFKAIAGDRTHLPQWQQDLWDAKESPQKRAAWCRQFLAAGTQKLVEVIPFIHLATPAEIGVWLSKEAPIGETSEMEVAFLRLLARAFRSAEEEGDLLQRSALADQVERFLNDWGDKIPSIAPERIFELAEKLFDAKLPHKSLGITSRLIPAHALWPSPFVVMHLKCLLETQQYKTFDDVVSRVAGADTSLMIMSFCSLRDEQLGDIASAMKISDQMVALAPKVPYGWYRGCYLRNRYRDESEQKEFHVQIPDSLLQNHSREVAAILYFLTKTGNFKRAEARWVEWFIDDPRGLAVELVNFHFGLITGGWSQFEDSPELEVCKAAFQFEQDGSTMIRLIVDEHHPSNECTLKASSQLAELLQRLPIGESANLGMTSYKVQQRLPPYVACLRIALQLRHIHNDGSDCFAMMKMPSDTAEMVPFLEEKLGFGGDKQLTTKVDDVPLFMRGHALYPDNAFKGALNCWTDVSIPKSWLFAEGEAEPQAVVLDAYSIGYLAVTDLAQHLLNVGVSFVLPATTKEALSEWLEEITAENFMALGVTEGGRLFRTTAADIRARDGHILQALRAILDNATVAHPVLHDTELEIYSIKEGIDSTAYDAMQLSLANDIPWLCMDGTFASLHHSTGYKTANANALVARAMASSPSDFEHKRHGLLLYASGALPLPLTFGDIHRLAANPNALAGFILFKIIQNHGHQIFLKNDQSLFLLDMILTHLTSRFYSGNSHKAVRPAYTPWTNYTSHVFNHGMKLFLAAFDVGTIEYRLAAAMMYMGSSISFNTPLKNFVIGHFMDFARGHFMDVEAIKEHLKSLSEVMDSSSVEAGQQ
ncbi:hypothetical protein SAMN04490189_0025 [Pseudomonas koreensis]|uniref:GapS6b family protein n=1 Tax=Pseudomonas koreensis TaxID=198620 RepID=UPI00087D53BC|nr:hypothetical protein [Pseudomonas koreensis]KAB0514161.1 hypothetical protein F7R05_07815 [Pseudomonas koreensis]NNA62630.1 hypothetical protein [Pseudomonas koreensis]SDC59670.1 hypothetical protein SAMN04490189_0025 [Pseudomonas koreensis]